MVRSFFLRFLDKTLSFRKSSKNKKNKEVVEECSRSEAAEDKIEGEEPNVEVPEQNNEVTMEFLELSRSTPLRADDFENATSAEIRDDKGTVIAKQTIIKYSPAQAYCVVSELSPFVAGKAVRVKEEDENRHRLKLVSIDEQRENRRLLPIFVQFHTVPEARAVEAHLTDRLSEDVLGRFNLELKKNVTLDSFAHSDTWRDEAGFIVTDRNRYELVSFDTNQLRKTLMPSNDVNISAYTEDDFDALCDFDNAVSGLNRDAALEFLTSKSTVYVGKGTGGIDGVIAGKGDRVLALYAETLEIAHALIAYYIKQNQLVQLSLFTRCEVWECEPASRRAVFRRHTRAIPSSIKWGKVFALNMGVHIV